jgi:5-methylcytosine-specific restriction endonuclease McrA
MKKKTPKTTPTGKPKKRPPYNQSSAVRSALRRAFSRSPIVWEILKEGKRYFAKFNKNGARAKKDGVETHCQVCDTWTRTPIKVAVDHIEPVVPVDGSFDPKNPDWNMYIRRLWCDKTNLQRICDSCHDAKTQLERKQRKEHADKLKNEERNGKV